MEANIKNRAALQAGKFTQMARPPGVDAPAPVEDPVADEDLESAGLVSDQADAEEDEYPDTQ
jgi:hypothetical protein